jgi:hypothetical protein
LIPEIFWLKAMSCPAILDYWGYAYWSQKFFILIASDRYEPSKLVFDCSFKFSHQQH